jgi:hypothetical protein
VDVTPWTRDAPLERIRAGMLSAIFDMENLTMRFLAVTVATAVVGLLLSDCDRASGPTSETGDGIMPTTGSYRAESHTKFTESFTEELVNPCNNEVVSFSGETINQVNNVDDLHSEILIRASGIGIGQESGASYAYTLVSSFSFNTPDGAAPQFTVAEDANARMISSVPALTFTAHFQFRGHALPSGEFKVSRDVNRVECKA